MADVWFSRDVGGADGTVSTSIELTVADVLVDPGNTDALDQLTSVSEPSSVTVPGAVPVADASVVIDPTKGLINDQNNNLLI
jgi:hypothetical protein